MNIDEFRKIFDKFSQEDKIKTIFDLLCNNNCTLKSLEAFVNLSAPEAIAPGSLAVYETEKYGRLCRSVCVIKQRIGVCRYCSEYISDFGTIHMEI